MTGKVDLFDSTYRHFLGETLRVVRGETFGEDFGQNSWLTADEYRRFIGWLELKSNSTVLEVASGSGGPALFLAQAVGCRVVGIDVNEHGVATAAELARQMQLDHQVEFRHADATQPLPFADDTFDALLCIDSINHFPDRARVLQDWRRVVKPGGYVLYTDPVVITGAVSNEELQARSSIGFFLFLPPGENERMIERAGLTPVLREDVTDNAAMISGNWQQARAKHRQPLIELEGEARFEGLQQFFGTVHHLTAERRLSRLVFLARR